MKKILLLVFIVPSFLLAQNNSDLAKENNLLKSRIDSLGKKLDDKYYTRVPNKDFDQQIEDAVDHQVGNYITGKIALVSTIFGIISFLLGFLAKYFFSESTRKQIEESVSKSTEKIDKENTEAQKKLNDRLDEYKEFIAKSNSLIADQIKDSNERIENFRTNVGNQILQMSTNSSKQIADFENTANNRIKQIEDRLSKTSNDTSAAIDKIQQGFTDFEKNSKESIEKNINDNIDFLWGDVIDGTIERAQNRKYEGETFVNSFERMLQSKLNFSKELRIRLIDSLMRCYYAGKSEKKYEMMVKLIQNYDDKYDLLPETYLNAAIALSNNYEVYGANDLKEKALSMCQKSIDKDREYGEPYAVQLEILMIEVMKSNEMNVQKKGKKEIGDQLYFINNIDSPALKGQLLQRLINDKSVSYLTKYITAIYQDYAKQLTVFRENVVTNLVKIYDGATDYYKKLMENLLSEGLQSNPNIDGTWVCTYYIKSGDEEKILNNEVSLKFKDSDYTFNDLNDEAESGWVYYLPDISPNAVLMLALVEGKVKMQKGIYKYEEPSVLHLCINETERPSEFVSTIENKNKLISFKKIAETEEKETT